MLHTGEWNVLIGADSFANATEKKPRTKEWWKCVSYS